MIDKDSEKTDPIPDDEQITENLLRKGAALAYGSKSKGHGDKAISHINAQIKSYLPTHGKV